MDRSGGVNAIEYHGPRRIASRRAAFYSNGIWRREDFFPEPVISFRLTLDGLDRPFPFAPLEVCPYGVSARPVLDGRRFECRVWVRGCVVLIEWRCQVGVAEVSLDLREGFMAHRNEDSIWEEPTPIPSCNGLRYNLLRRFVGGEGGKPTPTEKCHEACSVLGCPIPARVERRDGRASLTAALGSAGPTRFAITFAEDVHVAEDLFFQAATSWEEWEREQFRCYSRLAGRVPVLEADSLPEVAEVVRLAPLFIESMRREKNDREAGLRANTRGYGVWNAWDGQWAFKVLNLCADPASTRPILTFQNQRGLNGAVMMTVDYDFGPVYDINLHSPPRDRPLGAGWNVMHDCWAVEALHEYYFRNLDRRTLAAAYPPVQGSLRAICANAGPTGLVESCFGGADYSSQVNRPQFPDPRDNRTVSSRLSGVEDHALLFSACQQGAELAATMGDRETLEACADLSARIEPNFMRHFFDEELGFFVDCVWPKDCPLNRNRTLRLTEMMAFVGYADLLCMDEWDRLAETLLRRFTHPLIGLREVPLDQPMQTPNLNRCENWLQNSARDLLRFARLAGSRRLMDILLGQIRAKFDSEKVVQETFYNREATQFFNPAKYPVAASCWQAMTASAWWLGLLEAVAGLRASRGQLEHLPGDAGADTRLSNLTYARRRWDIRVAGRGPWIESLAVNGEPRPGTHQLIPNGGARLQRVDIRKTDRPPNHPVVLSAGAGVAEVRSVRPGRLDAHLANAGFCRLWFYAPRRPDLRVNGREVETRWSERRSFGTAVLVGTPTAEVEVLC
jgi:hypothetical protein